MAQLYWLNSTGLASFAPPQLTHLAHAPNPDSRHTRSSRLPQRHQLHKVNPMEYTLSPPLCAESQLQYMRFDACLQLSSGDEALTPTAVQWVLNVCIQCNGATMEFDIIENLLRCFVSGSFMTQWAAENEEPIYEQEKTGFRVVFPRGNSFPSAAENRREVKEMRVVLHFFHKQDMPLYADQETVFQDTLNLADYGFCTWMYTVEQLAPAVFTTVYKRISTIQPLMRPLKQALRVSRGDLALEHLVERAVVSNPAIEPDHKVRKRSQLSQSHTQARSRKRITQEHGLRHSQILTQISQDMQRHHSNLPKPDSCGVQCSPSAHSSASQNKILRVTIPSREPVTDLIEWESPGQYFRSQPFESRRFLVLTSESDAIHECVFLSQLVERKQT